MTPLQAGFSWIWDTFGEAIAKGSLDWGWKTAQWKRAADRYAERLEEDYGKLFVLGQPAPRDIDDIYTYVHLLEKVSAFKRYRPEQLQELYIGRGLFHERNERRDGLTIVQRKKRPNLFILGQPGAGKTTFLKQVTMKAVRGEMTRTIKTPWRDWLPEKVQANVPKTVEINPIPIFVSLKDHADSERTLLESVKHELSICRFPDGEKADVFVQYLLRSGGGMVLWDGLDEVSSDGNRRGKLVLEMQEFMRQYRETQFIITCRVAATEYSFDNVTYLEMADFDADQMEKFIFRWFDDQKVATRCWQELQKGENQGLRELARIPLLLTLLAITYEETQSFPQRRVEIYEEAIDALLKKWDSKRFVQRGEELYKALSLGRKRQMLATIGAETFGEGEFILPQRRLTGMIETYMQKVPGIADEVDGEAVLHSIAARHGIFVERAHKLYTFAHLSFQEYFAAKYIVSNTRRKTLELLLNHIDDTQWQEVFLLTASLLEEADADYFFDLFIARLNGMIADVKPVQKILGWAAEKQVSYSQWEELERKERAADNKYVMRTNYNLLALRALYQFHNLDHISDHALTFTRSLTLSIALSLDRNLDNALSLDSSSDYADAHTFAFTLARELGVDELAEQLDAFPPPADDYAPDEEWDTYIDNLHQVINTFRDLTGANYLDRNVWLGDVVWNEISKELYTAYIIGTALLIKCLGVARVGNRKEIEAQLLLPA